MTTNSQITYWIALAELTQMTTRRKNEILSVAYSNGMTIVDVFGNDHVWSMSEMSDKEIAAIKERHNQLPNIAFFAEDIENQGYHIIPLNDNLHYPQTLKRHLKSTSPLVIYCKGDIQLLQEPSVAIVGSRKANEQSLVFTDNVSKKVAEMNKVVVSGFAKGVDQQALVSTLKYNGKSIIVLPQGILQAGSTLRTYFPYISQGRVLVMSFFPPRMPWSVECAMARNPIIYGMADTIYVAQSDDKGGTWSGVMDGLRKQREIYVRVPEVGEHIANQQLIDSGAKAVDINGNETENKDKKIQEQLIQLLQTGEYSLSQIKEKLQLKEWKDDALRTKLTSLNSISIHKSRVNMYSLQQPMTLF